MSCEKEGSLNGEGRLALSGWGRREGGSNSSPYPHNDLELICFSHSFILPFIYLIDIYCAPSIS